MKLWTVRLSREPWPVWIVRDGDGTLVAAGRDWTWAVGLADRAARLPDVGGYV